MTNVERSKTMVAAMQITRCFGRFFAQMVVVSLLVNLQKRSMLPLVALKDLKNNSQQLQRLDLVVAGPG